MIGERHSLMAAKRCADEHQRAHAVDCDVIVYSTSLARYSEPKAVEVVTNYAKDKTRRIASAHSFDPPSNGRLTRC